MNEIVLIGNPNTGKTTLFNTLTKSYEKVSNWHGVTVAPKSKKIKWKDGEKIVSDLPGVYSLKGYSNEEKIAVDYLEKHRDSVVVNICDANNLKRNLMLTIDLVNAGYQVVVAVNMFDEKHDFDYVKLAKELGVTFVEIDARNQSGIDGLVDVLNNIKTQKTSKLNKNKLNYTNIVNKTAIFNKKFQKNKQLKIDNLLLNKWIFPFVFILILFGVFYVTFGDIGEWICAVCDVFFNKIFDILRKIILCTNMSNIIKTFIIEAIINSVQSVISFVPQIVLLMFFFNLLEDTGVISRMAFMLDGILKKVGLTGKSLFSLFMGYGCTTTAVLTTRNLESFSLRKRTAMLLPFASCSAKLPIYLVVSSLFFENYKYLFVFLLYLFSIIFTLIFALIYKKFTRQKQDIFVLEMPKYRIPNLKKILLDAWITLKDFLIKVGTVVVFFGAFVWLLQNFSTDFKFLFGENFNQSILYSLSNSVLPVFKIIGLDNVGLVCALFFGLVAKEMIVVGLALINGVSGSMIALNYSLTSASSVCFFSPTSSIVFLIFVLIYSPCISALSTIKNEFGLKTALSVFALQFVIAYVVCFLINLLFNNLILVFMLAVFVLAIVSLFVLKFSRKKSACRGNCYACRKIC